MKEKIQKFHDKKIGLKFVIHTLREQNFLCLKKFKLNEFVKSVETIIENKSTKHFFKLNYFRIPNKTPSLCVVQQEHK